MRPPSFIIFQLSKVHAGCSKHKQQRHHHWEPVQKPRQDQPLVSVPFSDCLPWFPGKSISVHQAWGG